MIEIYKTDIEKNETLQVTKYQKGNWINMVKPSENEIKMVCKKLKIQEEFIRYSLDPEEKARIDIEDNENMVLFIIDIPILEKEGKNLIYTTMPIGIIFVRNDYIITVSLEQNQIIQNLTKNKIKNIITYKKSRFLLQLLYENSELYLTLLKQINKEKETTESILKDSMKNKELLQLLDLEKSLVYFSTSLKSNETVMEKIMSGKIIKLYEEDEDLLEDTIIENKQAIEMAKIYSDILSGTMDAYASIISNNLNRVMKYLASVTIILSIPTVISGYFGMNMVLPFEKSTWGFPLILILSLIITLIVTIWLDKRDMLR